MKLTAQQIWNEFIVKLINDGLSNEDFTDDMNDFFMSFLTGENTKVRREKYAASPVTFFDTGTKAIILVKCPDDDYRFDFIEENGKIKLDFIEGITIPINDIKELPYTNFPPLLEKESWIRSEKAISKIVYFYNKFKEHLGKEEALKIFNDGAGEYIGAKSWVPFFDDRKSFIAYAAWIENIINGEAVSIDEFTDNKCIIRFSNHVWRRMYNITGHLKLQIPHDEYMELFEHIWQDRAKQSGWEIAFEYEPQDTILTFYIKSEKII